MGNPGSPYFLAQACALERSLQLRVTAMKSTREAVVTGYKSKLVSRRERTPRTDSDGGRDRHVSLVSYRPPQAGQSPVNKVLTRQHPPASMGAWNSVCFHDKRMETTHQEKHRKLRRSFQHFVWQAGM
ncbi:hypothetical protein DPMN_067873 [Dreissena polymorpha]|uniref:Uncharacterized protein n=1 Tax=Dreissena polymorpha TaxID=45954 RepID=A0A9D4BW59_DREPO|nr:hypothetical protein DPMN_067873 [Dreissena polymorpha]